MKEEAEKSVPSLKTHHLRGQHLQLTKNSSLTFQWFTITMQQACNAQNGLYQ